MKSHCYIILTICLFVLSDAASVLKADEASTRPPLFGAYPANTTICFDEDVGCFTNAYPFDNTGNYLPFSPDELKTEFILFTRNSINKEEILSYKDMDVVQNSNFNKNLQLKFIIHGFSNNRSTEWIHELKDAILKEDDVNVVVVAWGNGSSFPLYNNASSNIRLVGKQLGIFVNRLRERLYPNDPKKLFIHCIGHSLGAHTCGYGSNAARIRFNRISGLDPAGPFFEDTDPLVRLDPTDADFVDAIHSNGGTLLSASFGIMMPTAHVDFYVNGGKFQPGCPGLTTIIGGIFTGAADPTKEVGCSHNRVLQFYIESISSHCPFIGFNCPSEDAFDRGDCTSCADNKCSVMGYHAASYKGRGSLYLKTNPEIPYCGYHHLFELKISPNSPKSAGELLLTIEEETNNAPKPLTKSSDEIQPNSSIKRVFVTEHDLIDIDSVKLQFNKKSKPFLGSDPNAVKFLFDKIRLTNLEIDEDFSRCQPNSEISDKQILTIQLQENDCKINP